MQSIFTSGQIWLVEMMRNKKANVMFQSNRTGNDRVLQEMDGKNVWSNFLSTWQAYLVPFFMYMASMSGPHCSDHGKHTWSLLFWLWQAYLVRNITFLANIVSPPLYFKQFRIFFKPKVRILVPDGPEQKIKCSTRIVLDCFEKTNFKFLVFSLKRKLARSFKKNIGGFSTDYFGWVISDNLSDLPSSWTNKNRFENPWPVRWMNKICGVKSKLDDDLNTIGYSVSTEIGSGTYGKVYEGV